MCQSIFSRKGSDSFFCINYKEEEVTTRFMQEGDFIISIESFYEQTPSLENIITVEDSTIWHITHDQRQALCEEFPAYNFYSRALAEKYFVQDVKRMVSVGRKSAPERYQELLQQEPYLFNRASQQDIASYLGMTTEMLSSIIRNN